MPFPSIDNSTFVTFASVQTATLGIVTNFPNELILVDVANNGSGVNGVSNTGGLTFTQHAVSAIGGNNYERWSAIATSINQSGFNVTVTINATAYIAFTLTGIANTNPAAPFDAGGPITHSGSPSDPLSITPISPTAMVYAGFRTGPSVPSAGAGFNLVSAMSGAIVEYVNPQTPGAVSCTLTNQAGNSNGAVIDAIVGTTTNVTNTSQSYRYLGWY